MKDHTASRSSGAPSARLLTSQQAAAYLGYQSVATLRHLPISPVRLTERGAGSAVRWDRDALDRLIDQKSGIAPISPDDGEEKMKQWARENGFR